jgi:hypothetical protein
MVGQLQVTGSYGYATLVLRRAVHTASKSMHPFQTIKLERLHAMDIQCTSSHRQLDALRISVGLDELAITNENATSTEEANPAG